MPKLVDQPPIWREGLVGLEAARLAADPVFRGEGVRDAGGQPVMLVPGFLAGDVSLGTMTSWLRRTGHRTGRAGIRSNVDCSEASVDRLVGRLERLAERRGRRVALIGQSRGGCLARVMAIRRPDLVSGVIGLGSPTVDPLAIHPLVHLQVIAVGALGSLGTPGMFSRSCIGGDCCASFRADSTGPFPTEVGFVSLYSRTDGIVDWRSCLDPAAELTEVSSSHCGMAVNAEVYRHVAAALARFRELDERRAPAGAELRAA